MKSNRRTCLSVFAACIALLLTCVIGLPAGVAYGDVESIAGMDQYYGTGEVPSTIDILSVTGSENDTVYIEVKEGKKTIASHLAFTLGEDTAQQDGSKWMGVVSVQIAAFDPAQTYSITVYADRQQTKELYSGQMSPVFAELEGQSNLQLIALRTLGKEKRSFTAPESVSFAGVTYALDDSKPVAEEPLTFAYTQNTSDEAVSGSVTYVDEQGNEITKDDLGLIAAGEFKTVAIPAVVSNAAGDLYRTLSFSDSVTVANPGMSNAFISCKAFSATQAYATEGHPYLARIHLMDTEGNKLADDSINVDKAYRYTPPARIHLRNAENGLVDTYVLSTTNASLTAEGVLFLSPSTEAVENNQQDINITYEKLGNDAEVTWTVVVINGAADPKASDRVIKKEILTVKPGEEKTYKTEPSITIGEKTFVPVASTKEEYTFKYGEGDEPVLNIYYVPDDYVPAEPYEITVQYVNIANKEVLQSHTLTARPQDRDELVVWAPKDDPEKYPTRFTQDGVEYVVIAGQEQTIFHSYYSSNRVYNIYFRDINDDLSASLVITTMNVEYTDGPTTYTYVDGGTTYTYVDGGTTTTTTDGGTTTTDGGTTETDGGTTTRYVDGGTTYIDGGGTTTFTDGGTTTTTGNGGTVVTDAGYLNGTVNGDGSTNASIPNGEALTVINGGSNSTVTDSSGRDTNTMRIEDNETPLAGPGSSAEASSRINPKALISLGLLAALAVAYLLFVFFKRRKDDEEDEEANQVE